MICANCKTEIVIEMDSCPQCGCRLDGPLHEELSRLDFTAARIEDWHARKVIRKSAYKKLLAEIARMKSAIIDTLRERPEPPENPSPEGEPLENPLPDVPDENNDDDDDYSLLNERIDLLEKRAPENCESRRTRKDSEAG